MKKLLFAMVMLFTLGFVACNDNHVEVEGVKAPMEFSIFVENNTSSGALGTKSTTVERPDGIQSFIDSLEIKVVNTGNPTVKELFDFVDSDENKKMCIEAYAGECTVYLATERLRVGSDTPVDWGDYDAFNTSRISVTDDSPVVTYSAEHPHASGWSCGHYALNGELTTIAADGSLSSETGANYIAISKLRDLDPFAPYAGSKAVTHTLDNSQVEAIGLTTQYGRVVGSIEFADDLRNLGYTVECRMFVNNTFHKNIPCLAQEGSWFYWSNEASIGDATYHFQAVFKKGSKTIKTLTSKTIKVVAQEDTWITLMVSKGDIVHNHCNWQFTTPWDVNNTNGEWN